LLQNFKKKVCQAAQERSSRSQSVDGRLPIATAFSPYPDAFFSPTTTTLSSSSFACFTSDLSSAPEVVGFGDGDGEDDPEDVAAAAAAAAPRRSMSSRSSSYRRSEDQIRRSDQNQQKNYHQIKVHSRSQLGPRSGSGLSPGSRGSLP